jgi:hypothetical protein
MISQPGFPSRSRKVPVRSFRLSGSRYPVWLPLEDYTANCGTAFCRNDHRGICWRTCRHGRLGRRSSNFGRLLRPGNRSGRGRTGGDGFSLGRIPLKPVKRGKDVPDLFGSAFGRRQHPELIPVKPHGEVRSRDGPSLNARQISRGPSQPQRDRTGR